jgi:hypothetical protein
MRLMYFSQDRRWVYQIKYETSIDLQDLAALEPEAEVVLQHFEKQLDPRVTAALISANEHPQNVFLNIISVNDSYSFLFEKTKDGKWHVAKD